MSKLVDLTGQTFGQWLVLQWVQSPEARTFWLCQCSCGTERLVDSRYLRNGRSKSCGCREMPTRRWNHRGYADFYYWAQKRGEVGLTDDQWYELTQMPCHYCGKVRGKPSGIDRIDPSQGYYWDNCLPACWLCNRAKNDLSYDEFLDLIRDISEHQENQ